MKPTRQKLMFLCMKLLDIIWSNVQALWGKGGTLVQFTTKAQGGQVWSYAFLGSALFKKKRKEKEKGNISVQTFA